MRFLFSAVITVRAAVVQRPRSPVYFTANHPFIYFIRSDNDILFMGRYVGMSDGDE